MSEKTLAVKPTEDLIVKLREGSGEGGAQSFPFVPLIKVDNSKEMTKLADGREQEVLCPKRWVRADKKGDDYVNTNIDGFGGVILVEKWFAYNKGKYNPATKTYDDNGTPTFKSKMFSPEVFFGKKIMTIKYEDGGSIEQMTYPEFKAKFTPNYKIECTLFVWYNNEVVRVKLAGASKGAIFDYKKLFKSNDSISAHKTAFEVMYESKPQPHNKALLKIADDVDIDIDWNDIVLAQAEINKMFAADKLIETTGGEVIEEVEADEIKVDEIPFIE